MRTLLLTFFLTDPLCTHFDIWPDVARRNRLHLKLFAGSVDAIVAYDAPAEEFLVPWQREILGL
ncbi:MAG: hypothetical protein M3Y27_27150 [Acidobacteriota bacterium]|nr:hypothetical protein [Acidobacteriota bacterium]